MRVGRTLTALAALLVAATLVGAVLLQRAFVAPGPLTEDAVVLVPRGAGLAETARILASAGAVSNAELFALATWLRGDSRSLRAGEYRIAAGAAMRDVLLQIRSGAVLQRRFTVAEGGTVWEVVAELAANPLLSGAPPEPPPEGSLAPETYFYSRGDRRILLLERMRAAQRRTLYEFWFDRPEGLPLRSPEEALILASVIEKETGLASERSRVASVFVNRLRRGMRLQSDPTVIYGITGGTGSLGRPLLRSDLTHDSPYNTYVVRGLPPGPICNPGPASIEAALQPEETDFLYFVADGTGGHAFARTLEEHNRNVARWRRIQRERRKE